MNSRNKLVPVTSLRQLRNLAETDARYRDLIMRSAMNLGAWRIETIDQAHRWLEQTAMETDSEEGVIAEVNFCI